MTRLIGIAAVLVAAVLWGTTGTVQALLPPDRSPVAVGAMRLILGAAGLIVLAALTTPWRGALADLPTRHALGAGAFIAAYNLLFFRAVAEAGVGVGTAVTIGSAPVWTTAAETILSRRLPTTGRLAAQGVSIAGVVILGLSTGGGAGSGIGILLALGAGASYAGYSLLTHRAGGRVPSTVLAAATFAVAALIALPALVIAPTAWLWTPGALAAMAFLGLGATALSYAFYTWGLGILAASTAVTLALAEPVTAWLLATFVVGEPVTSANILGAFLILAGLIFVTRTPAPRD